MTKVTESFLGINNMNQAMMRAAIDRPKTEIESKSGGKYRSMSRSMSMSMCRCLCMCMCMHM